MSDQSFVATFAVIRPGDYNADQTIGAADYVAWRKYLGTSMNLPNDTTPGSVTEADYSSIWKVHFAEGSVPGDFNANQIADSADYVAWRKLLDSNVHLPNVTTPGSVISPDYNVWKAHFGTEIVPPAQQASAASAQVATDRAAAMTLRSMTTRASMAGLVLRENKSDRGQRHAVRLHASRDGWLSTSNKDETWMVRHTALAALSDQKEFSSSAEIEPADESLEVDDHYFFTSLDSVFAAFGQL
jgi:hypothetical protein